MELLLTIMACKKIGFRLRWINSTFLIGLCKRLLITTAYIFKSFKPEEKMLNEDKIGYVNN